MEGKSAQSRTKPIFLSSKDKIAAQSGNLPRRTTLSKVPWNQATGARVQSTTILYESESRSYDFIHVRFCFHGNSKQIETRFDELAGLRDLHILSIILRVLKGFRAF